jgi:hypothetical protein
VIAWIWQRRPAHLSHDRSEYPTGKFRSGVVRATAGCSSGRSARTVHPEIYGDCYQAARRRRNAHPIGRSTHQNLSSDVGRDCPWTPATMAPSLPWANSKELAGARWLFLRPEESQNLRPEHQKLARVRQPRRRSHGVEVGCMVGMGLRWRPEARHRPIGLQRQRNEGGRRGFGLSVLLEKNREQVALAYTYTRKVNCMRGTGRGGAPVHRAHAIVQLRSE